MAEVSMHGDVRVSTKGELGENIALLEICRAPHNFFDEALIRDLADQCEALGEGGKVRALVLASEGSAFCAGGKFTPAKKEESGARPTESLGHVPNLYRHALRLISQPLPLIALIQGAATGGGFGVALTADFRIVAPEARFWANFASLGIYPGFGLTTSLPRLIGTQKAADLFLTARRVKGEEALALGLADRIAPLAELREAGLAMARDIAAQAPLAIAAIRARQRRELISAFAAAVDEEWREQARLFTTEDHKEGVRAVSERRVGKFTGK